MGLKDCFQEMSQPGLYSRNRVDYTDAHEGERRVRYETDERLSVAAMLVPTAYSKIDTGTRVDIHVKETT